MALHHTVFLVKTDLVILLVAVEEPVAAIDAGDAAHQRTGKAGEGVKPKPVDNDTGSPANNKRQNHEPMDHIG